MSKINDLQIQTSGELFEAVQLKPCFDDSKYFVDMTPKRDTNNILKDFRKLRNNKNFDLLNFIKENFDEPIKERKFHQNSKPNLIKYITKMWDFLSQNEDSNNPDNSLIALPKPYIIPGGRFREVYYWDTYFTCEGLLMDNKLDTIQNIAENFKYLIDTIGFIPNGNRTYYLTRSQPPLFFLIIDIIYRKLGIRAIKKYLPTLEKEYNFWMSGERNVNNLNRYWDDSDTPRPESYLEDITHAKNVDNKNIFYRNIRAACESGWDFSSRWFDKDSDFNTLQTTDILPIDLNCYIYGIENSLATWFNGLNEAKTQKYSKLAESRKNLIQSSFWSQSKNFFCDINFKKDTATDILSLAGATPLFLEIATKYQAEHMANTIKSKFLTEYGLLTTTNRTSQQWDSPNAWAPLQYQTVIGLEKYGYYSLAKEIATKFVNTVNKKYLEIGKIREKYDVIAPDEKATGGEYIVQDGFGWTNGVVSAFIKKYNLKV